MNYNQTVDYLYGLLPSFQEQGATALDYKLDKTRALLEEVGNPHKSFKVVHVGGTNGKGTTSHLIAAALSDSGYKVGLYTSPHLISFTERIKVGGEEIGEEEVIDFVRFFKDKLEKYAPSFFEMTVVLAFYFFKKRNIDVAVVEVGLGGRFDATNVVDPLLSVITNVSMDHQEFLGNTISSIAREKAGIIKQNKPIVIGEYHSDSFSVFSSQSTKKSASMYKAFEFELPKGLIASSDVDFIALNKRTAYVSLLVLSNFLAIETHRLSNPFNNYNCTWGLKGRWQQLGDHPTVICDTGHNLGGVALLVKQLALVTKSIHLVWGMSADKDTEEILSLLPKDAMYYFCSAENRRSLPVEELVENGLNVGLKGKGYPSVNAALNAAKVEANEEGFVFIGGSTFVVAELKNL